MTSAAQTRAATPVLSEAKALHFMIERLFDSEDAQAVADIVAEVLAPIDGLHVYWLEEPLEALEKAPEDRTLRLGHDPRGQRTLMARLPTTLDSDDHAQLAWLAKLVDVRLHQQAELSHLYDAVSRLAQAERLQRALFAIANQASAVHDMDETMHALHGIVGSLMYAENFYIALYDSQRDALRFAYYADTTDTDPPPPDTYLSMDSIRESVTWYLIREGHALYGNLEQIRAQVQGDLHPSGPPPVDWLGVPLLRGSEVVGGLVVQSYHEHARYTEQDRELLAYVAQHVQTALERREAHADLERRVAERTEALRNANRVLQQQVIERQRGERLQTALFRIAELANTTDSLDDFYAAVHRVVGGLLYSRNFYIALLSDDGRKLDFPYSVDEIDADRRQRSLGRGLTEYVLRHGEALLADRARMQEMTQQRELIPSGSNAFCWLGVPLICEEKTVGVLAVQSYTPEYVYKKPDQELLTFVGYHIANALQRKRSAESLKKAYSSLERRVTERTRALALANRDLREQISERERIERRLKYETLHDALTGLPNRALLLQRLEQALRRYHEDESRRFAVLFIDLDRFKVINDSVGHLIGDDLLFQVGGRIRTCVKSDDIVARLGGDEFAVLLESVGDEPSVFRVAERIISELNNPIRVGGKEMFTSASIGITLSAPHYRRAEELLRDADSAMYSAKASGRHRAAWFDDRLRRNALSVLEIEGDLRRAMTRNEFEPFFQPIVHLDDGRILGYEALMRWRHPERGLLLPGAFLTVAEDSGCIEAIDWQIFEQVFAHAPTLTRDGAFVSINVSGRHLRMKDIDHRLLSLLDEHGVAPKNLRIEVTERTLLENPEQIKLTLDRLRDHGIAIALDDFGTGYSSLSYLHQYPIGVLKIDRSFTARIDTSDDADKQGAAIFRAIQALADSMQMQVIVEGVENGAQRDLLLELGCRYGQGFLYSGAEPAEHWLSRGATGLS
ncbi:bifunctional diguanylate cyclase/phosphodiesterase [Oleiagrimonas sp. MCCC 1A03011]|nr:EAL domain-containing protein [Oleiagrimonas sp. MCCC 1A03011]RAP58453.1 bifunctional diguanylate cyclase/phosphodiesterase [Oleiagrimonas sp. MCCC 1A03011]